MSRGKAKLDGRGGSPHSPPRPAAPSSHSPAGSRALVQDQVPIRTASPILQPARTIPNVNANAVTTRASPQRARSTDYAMIPSYSTNSYDLVPLTDRRSRLVEAPIVSVTSARSFATNSSPVRMSSSGSYRSSVSHLPSPQPAPLEPSHRHTSTSQSSAHSGVIRANTPPPVYSSVVHYDGDDFFDADVDTITAAFENLAVNNGFGVGEWQDFDEGDEAEGVVEDDEEDCTQIIEGPDPSIRRWYVVSVGRRTGVYSDWNEVASLVKCPGGTQKGYDTWYDAYTAYTTNVARGRVTVVPC
ncbi:hypothetical protein EIP91_011273 [Steccherinum ochraceum]|uniref:Ribonuclease H1 N-terminal domain-containing protein n=1 Tax=Steccherinum ochraceum TaxID=92696 RepID=A0A4R0QZU8_9APHY|nr:hypothetical protein EIP91_011273 [Steccherinum ochraceum]